MAGRRNRPWYKRYPSDFLAGTRGMRPLLFKTYARLIDGTYEYGGPLPNDAQWLAHLLELRVADVPRMIGELADMGKVKVDNGLIHNGRADKEIEAMNAHLSASESQVSAKSEPSNEQVESKWKPDSHKKHNENYARAGDHAHDHPHPRPEAETDKKEGPALQAGALLSFNDSALPPREAAAVAASAVGPPLPPQPTQVEPTASQLSAEELVALGEVHAKLIAKLAVPKPVWNGTVPPSRLKEQLDAKPQPQPDDDAEPGRRDVGQGELPDPARAPSHLASPQTPPEPEGGAGSEEPPDPNESPLMRALRTRRPP